jgi:protein O-GlcNAc transferase
LNFDHALAEIRGLVANGDWQSARELSERALANFSDRPQFWFFLGVSFHKLGDRSAAAAALLRASELAPEVPAVFNALATVLMEEERFAQALDAMSKAVALAPSESGTLVNYGIALERMGKLQPALLAYERALEVDIACGPARLNRGALLMTLGRFRDAVENNEILVGLQPDSADAFFNLSQSLLGLGRSELALVASQRAIALDPRHVKANIDHGLALADLGRFAEAHRAFDTVEVIAPGAVRAYLERIAPLDPALGRSIDPKLFFLYRSHDRLMCCDWSIRDLYITQLEELAASAEESGTARIELPLAYHSLTVPLPPQVPYRIACVLGDRYAAAVAGTGVRFSHRREWSRTRIRIGYLSADFCEHLNAYLSYPLFRMHDRSRFEVFAYSIRPDDGAKIREKIRGSAYRFVDLHYVNDIDAAKIINSDCIDVLVDFGGYTEHCRPGIAAFRPAPVQVAHIGFPGSMGAPWIDYRITDRVATPPEQERYWREKLVFMPHSFFLYDGEQDTPDEHVTRAQYGLPEGAVVLCSHNTSYKIDPEIFSLWMLLLRQLPSAVLWLVARDPAIKPNLWYEAEKRGVERARIVFAHPEPMRRYFSRYRLADLFLDTPQFTAATTACDALWMGLPLLSVRRGHFTSRQAASILNALGMSDLIVDTLEEYRDAALRLAQNPDELKAIRQRLERARDEAPMFRTADYVRHYERALKTMTIRWRNGETAENLHVLADGTVRPG